MKVTLGPKETVDLKALLSAVADDVIVVEWAETIKDTNALVYLVNTTYDAGSFDKYEGVILHPDSSSVNYTRGTTVGTGNVFVHNDSKLTLNVLTYKA
jgi:hypothetical protein